LKPGETDGDRKRKKGPSRIRTGDGGFAIRSVVSASDETQTTSDDAPLLFAPGLRETQDSPPVDDGLQRVHDDWSVLPEATKAGIQALIDAAKKG